MSSERRAASSRMVGASALGGVLAAMALAGCALPAASSRSPPPTPSEVPVSITPSESVPGADTWGPLAVIPGEASADTALTRGTLRITDSCVFLEERGEPVLLLWPADRSIWDAEQRTITFANFDGTTATIGDGQPVALGGGGGSVAESGVSVEEWLAQMHWVARPAEECPLDPYWAVGDVRP